MQFTPTERVLLATMADGMPHLRLELLRALGDDETGGDRLKTLLSLLRKKLRPNGQDVICELKNRRVCYRHVRLLASAVNGKR